MPTRDVRLRPRTLSTLFSAHELIGHFVLSRDPPAVSWRSESLAGWYLAVHEKLPCVPVRSEGELIGWLLGNAIGPDGNMVDGDLALAPNEEVEPWIYAHSGRFAVILPRLRRIYLDPCGLLGVVYCGDSQMVASNPALIPYERPNDDRIDLMDAMGIPYQNAMFPVGMTPRRSVHRLLPNHYLDLQSWRPQRHWPNQPLHVVEDASSAIVQIAELCKRHMKAIVEDGPTALRLTAGKDSRMLLACAKAVAPQLESITLDLGDEASRVDCQTARRVASSVGIPHRSLEQLEPEQRDLHLWLFRTGMGTGAYRGWRGSTSYRIQLDPQRSDVVGSVGEVGRGFYWKPDDVPETEISPERLLRHCNCPLTPETVRQVRTWLESAPGFNALQLLDLFYVEQRLGCWAGIWTYASGAHSRYQAFPLSHRKIIELMLRLPVEVRRQGSFPVLVIEREWPKLLAYPFNPPSKTRRVKMWLKKWTTGTGRALIEPRWAMSKLGSLLRGRPSKLNDWLATRRTVR